MRRVSKNGEAQNSVRKWVHAVRMDQYRRGELVFDVIDEGPADGPVKTAVFSGNTARLYGIEQHAELVNQDRFAALKAEYQRNGPGRSNLRYGYVSKPA